MKSVEVIMYTGFKFAKRIVGFNHSVEVIVGVMFDGLQLTGIVPANRFPLKCVIHKKTFLLFYSGRIIPGGFTVEAAVLFFDNRFKGAVIIIIPDGSVSARNHDDH